MDERNSDNTLIKGIQKEDESALLVLTKRYQNVCLKLGWKYKLNLGDEVMSIVYEAAKKYDKSKKTKFSTWLHNFTFYKIKNEQRKVARERQFIDNYAPEENVKEGYSSEELLNCISNKEIRQIVSLKHMGEKELSYEEVGKILGISRQWVIVQYRRGLEIIKIKLKSL